MADDADDTLGADSFQRWTTVADEVRATTKRLAKSAALERYLPTLASDDTLAIAARFFAGQVFPRHDMRTTQVGGRAVFDAVVALSGVDEEEVRERSMMAGEIGDLARELFADRAPSGKTVGEVAEAFATLAATPGSTARRALVRTLLASFGAAEMQYAIKLLLGGELRIGLKEAQVEEAAARAFGRPLASLRQAALLRGDVGEIVVLARHDRLHEARLSLFHPLGFMLAQPLETADEIVETLSLPFAVEDKYDGIRAQAHVGADAAGTGGRAPRVALYSRTLDEVTHGYPDVAAALARLPDGLPRARGLILDGELIAVDPADPTRALPFKALQRRLGRKAPDAALLAEVPVQLVVYDVLAWDGALVIDEPYETRRGRLTAIAWPEPTVRLAPNRLVSTADEVEAAFTSARAAGNEGLIAKALASPYTPGRRGKLWVKLKKALATLDVVITGAERGHGRRAKVLSDYTFAVRASESDPTLLNVGKAYGGLTDVEIAALSERLIATTTQRFGRFHQVTPEIVLEVTFDVVQPSARHKAGFALRFPRIVRIRDDKPATEVDTLDKVRALAN